MSMFEAIEDFFDEDAKFDRAYSEGYEDGEDALEEEEILIAYEDGFHDGYYSGYDEYD